MIEMNQKSTSFFGTRLSVSNPKFTHKLHRFQVRAGVTNSNDLKNGLTLEINNEPFRVMEFLHVKPGKGSAFVRTKLKNCITGSILDKTFRAGEQLTTAEVQKRNCQFTYSDNDEYIFMDMESFEEHRLIKEESWAKFLVEGLEVDLTFYQTRVIGVDPPQTVEMKVVAAEAGVKGNTAQGGTHPVTLESGAVISAPLFVGVGDKIKIDTKRELYLSRV